MWRPIIVDALIWDSRKHLHIPPVPLHFHLKTRRGTGHSRDANASKKLKLKKLAKEQKIGSKILSTLWIQSISMFTHFHRFQDIEEMGSCAPTGRQKPKVRPLTTLIKFSDCSYKKLTKILLRTGDLQRRKSASGCRENFVGWENWFIWQTEWN